ncbi:MAG: glycosyltransferase [Candidatus Taylorbacteria bacterium]
MNILEINTVDNIGGAAKIAYSIKKKMETLGHHVSMFVKIKISDDKNVFLINRPSKLSFWVQKITGKDIIGYIFRKIRHLISDDIDFFSSDNILNTAAFKEADIIHCHNLHGNYFNLNTLKKICSIKPVIWTFHDMWPITAHCAHAYACPVRDGFYECPSLLEYQSLAWHNEKYLRYKKRKIYGSSDFHIVVPCNWLKDKVENTILKNKPLSVIHNGIDTSIFRQHDKMSIRRELHIAIDKKIVLFIAVGKNSVFKGLNFFLASARDLRENNDIIFICVGGNVNSSDENYPPNIISIDYIKDKMTLAKYYSASDVLLFPSLAENFPLTVLEAMSCGLPVVSFDTGGIREVITHGHNGYIAKYSDNSDLIRGIKHIFNLSHDEHEAMSKLSREKVSSMFSEDLMVKHYINLYEKKLVEYKTKAKYD